jgi:hypothetical protein
MGIIAPLAMIPLLPKEWSANGSAKFPFELRKRFDKKVANDGETVRINGRALRYALDRKGFDENEDRVHPIDPSGSQTSVEVSNQD